MAWYDEPGDFQTDTSYGGTYDPSGGDIYNVQLPGRGTRMPWETEFTPSTWLYSREAERWNQAERVLRDNNAKRQRELENLQNLLGYYEGSGDFVTQWLIGNSMKQIRARMEDSDKAIGMGQMAMIRARNRVEGEEGQGWNTLSGQSNEGAIGTRLDQYERWQDMANRPLRTDEQKNTEYPGLEIPDWMEGFMADTETGLAPLSARADLDAEEMGGLQSYMGYVKADRPQFYSEDYVQKMQGLPNWWEKYTKESQKLFPTSGKARTTSWSTARQ